MIEDMQQTEKLKLNLIETGDPLSPAPLNENAQKLETALAAALAGEEAARTAADTALAQRVIDLEEHKLRFGFYIGDGTATLEGRILHLGFTPIAIWLFDVFSNSFKLLTEYNPLDNSFGTKTFEIVENGVRLSGGTNPNVNQKDRRYLYVAIV